MTEHDRIRFDYTWGWTVEWLGWRRMLWLTVCLDFHLMAFGGVFFGLMIYWGRKLKPAMTCTWPEKPIEPVALDDLLKADEEFNRMMEQHDSIWW